MDFTERHIVHCSVYLIRLKSGVDNRVEDDDDDEEGDNDSSRSLRRIFFPPGANGVGNSNATRIINWKIINRGRQTIIII